MFHRMTVSAAVFWLAFASGAAFVAAAERPDRVTRWTADQGLPHNLVQDIAQTPDGYLWLATRFGLVRFDGVRFTTYDKYNTPALVNDAISSVAVDREGTLWVGTLDGLVAWRGGVQRRYTVEDGLPDRKVWQVLARPESGMWWRSGNRIGAWVNGRLSLFTTAQGLVTDGVWCIKITPRGELLAFTAIGAQRLDASRQRFGPVTPWPSPGERRDAAEDAEGHLWMGDAQGLHRYENERWVDLGGWFTDANISGEHPQCLAPMRDDGWWIGTREAGAFVWRDGRFDRFTVGADDVPMRLTCVTTDREGNTWLGTDGAGLVQLRRRILRTFTERDGLPDRDAWSVCAAADGSVWVGTQRGAARIRNDKVEPLALPSAGWKVNPVGVDAAGTVWLARPGQDLQMWAGGVLARTPDEAVPSSYVSVFHLDRERRFWIGQPHEVLLRTPDGQMEHPFPDAFRESVRAVLEDSRGDVWFGTYGAGVKRWRGGRLESFTTADGLSNNRAWAFHEDAEGAVWIGTESGLTRWKAGKFFAFTERHGLREPVVNHVLEDDTGHLWLSGLRGLCRIRRSQLEAVAEGRVARAPVAAFGEADGMANAESNGENQPAGCKTADGRLWFPTQGGVVVIDPRAIRESDLQQPVVIEEVRAGGKQVGDRLADPLRINPGQGSVVEIRYTANSLSAPEKVRFKWKLEPRDADWHDAGAQRYVFLQNLRPGSYTFRVQACNQHGLWNEKGAELAFILAPHFQETWGFYALCGVAVIAAAAGFTAYRLRWQGCWLTARHGQAMSDERARIARDLHDDLGTSLMGVALELDMAKRQSGGGIAGQLGESATRVRSLAERMREAVWAVNPECDTVSSLASFLEHQAGALLNNDGVRGRFEFPEDIPPLPLDSATRHQLALGVREALTNALRHAQASEVVLALALREDVLVIDVRDDGRGFDVAATQPEQGHGLHNLRTRLERVGGVVRIDSKPGAGTRIEMQVPLAEEGRR